MLKKLNAYKFGTVSICIALEIGLTCTMIVLPSNAVGQSKIVSIVKGASNPSSTEPYNPSPLSIPVGTTVTWINNDNTGHTVTQGNPSGNTPPYGFDSGILAPGKTFTHTFGTAGTIQYYCTLHPTMLGEVILIPSSTYAVTSASAMSKPTSRGSLNVVLQPSPYPIVKGTQTNLKISFDQKGTSTVQPHIDYDVTISKAGKQLFNAVTLAGQSGPSLHTSEGITTIPYTFQEPGIYSIKITVFGILFNPINPESALFQVNFPGNGVGTGYVVVPEFPGFLSTSLIMALMIGTMLLMRVKEKYKLKVY